ncbi:minor head protein [Enterococcus faecalis]|uniref:phage minor head protein n=1 Tax=Enterococcus faecalis TaxID=1351 RepID=UPI00033045FB|nr:phage minor head protein [Enterococcus faecalis]EOJ75533.1 phage minor head protein [Enterococcus faecalis EnGen0355]VFA72499.1 minor head protein [Enterococcus faecalis]
MTKKKTTASERYWEKRRELEDKARLKLEKKTLVELESVFERALVKIQRQLLSQADLHDITQSEMLEDFSKRDQEKYRKYIEKNYEKLMESDEAYKQFIDEHFPSYDYAKVNRLLQLRADIFSTLADEAIASDVNGKFNNDLENITKRIYNSNSNALMQLLGGSASGLSKKELENILNYPWSGKTFSSRLWGNISSLEQRLSNSIINSLASGEGVLEALRTMKNDGVISGMFKLEQGKFNRSIENLVRTEYSHFAVEGIRESFRGANVKESESWSAEDERVCSICGGFHGQLIKNEHPPYHTLCRCTEIPRIPEISDDIDALYEEMFGDLLDEFANENWGVKLNHPKEAVKDSVFDKTNMADAFGKDNYNDFLNTFNSLENSKFKEALEKLGNQLEFFNINDVRAYALENKIQISKESLTGNRYAEPMEIVFHEMGHAIDSLGAKVLDSDFDKMSEMPTYQLKKAIQKDLLKTFNNVLKEANGDSYQQVKNLKKLSIFDQSSIVKKYKKLSEKSPKVYSALSDMMESTGGFIDYPLGFGHGSKYWKKFGKQETEFFAHMSETIINEEARKMMYETFPTASKMWENMLDDILKAVE